MALHARVNDNDNNENGTGNALIVSLHNALTMHEQRSDFISELFMQTAVPNKFIAESLTGRERLPKQPLQEVLRAQKLTDSLTH